MHQKGSRAVCNIHCINITHIGLVGGSQNEDLSKRHINIINVFFY